MLKVLAKQWRTKCYENIAIGEKFDLILSFVEIEIPKLKEDLLMDPSVNF